MATSSVLPVCANEPCVISRGGRRFSRPADLDADRQDVAVIRGLRADALDVLIDEVLSGASAPEAGGPDLGDVPAIT